MEKRWSIYWFVDIIGLDLLLLSIDFKMIIPVDLESLMFVFRVLPAQVQALQMKVPKMKMMMTRQDLLNEKRKVWQKLETGENFVLFKVMLSLSFSVKVDSQFCS